MRGRKQLARRLAPQDEAAPVDRRDAIRRIRLSAFELFDVFDRELQVGLESASVDAMAFLNGLGADELLEHRPREAYLRSRRRLHLKPESHRAVVHETDLHVRAEAPGFDTRFLISKFHELLKQALAFLRRRTTGEARTQAFAGVGDEGELRNGEQRAAGVEERAVHLAVIVGENAVSEHTFGQPRGFGVAVAALHADQRYHAFADRAHSFAADGPARPGNAPTQREHAMLSGMSRVRSRAI